MLDCYVGVDVGGTSVKFAIANRQGEILISDRLPTDSHAGPEVVLQTIGTHVLKLCEQCQGRPISLGMGLPGLVDSKNGIARYLPNMMSHWRDVPVRDILSPIVNCPVDLLNDVRMATLGEMTFGVGKSSSTMVFMAIGTGIGGGIAIDGRLHLGPHGAAGELGHQTIDSRGPLCGCGNYGCLETLASGTAIAAEGIRLMLVGMAPNLHRLVNGDAGAVTVQKMGEVVEQDPAIKNAILHAASYIAIGLANVVVTIHPELIVIGGGVANLGNLLINEIKNDLRTRIGRLFPVDEIRIETSKLGSDAGMMGGVALAIHGLPA